MCQWSQAGPEEKWFPSVLNSVLKGQELWIQGKGWQNIILFLVNYKGRESDLAGFYYDWLKQCLTVIMLKKKFKKEIFWQLP